MLQKIKAYMAQNQMIAQGDCVVAGVSGGADSVCLFLVLCELRKQVPFDLRVVHVHHGLRADADVDEAYVEELCLKEGIPFYPVHVDVAKEAAKRRIGEEEAGRLLRYEAFEKVLFEALEEEGKQNGKIAVAHNLDDQAETVLFRLLRGTGLKGLVGMEPVRERVIRPLLCVSRKEIEAWLEECGSTYRTDESNLTDAYARNRIRRHILTYAEQEICSGAAAHISKTAEFLRQTSEYLNRQIRAAWTRSAVCTEQEILFRVECWKGEDSYLQKELILEAFRRLTPAAKDIGAVHVEQVCGLFDKQTGRRLDLPGELYAKRDYDHVIIGKNDMQEENGKALSEQEENIQPEESFLTLQPSEGLARFGEYEICWRVFENKDCRDDKDESALHAVIPKNDFTKWFDYDKIIESPCIRYRRAGDQIVINSQGGKKSVKEYMIHEKVAAAERGTIPLLADGNRILWIVGYRMGADYKVSIQTKNILEVRILGGK